MQNHHACLHEDHEVLFNLAWAGSCILFDVSIQVNYLEDLAAVIRLTTKKAFDWSG